MYMSKFQQGVGTIMLITGIVILVLLGFIAFKLYIEPTKIPLNEIKPEEQRIIPKDSFSQRESEPAPLPGNQAIANPASENCIKNNGTLKIMKNGSGAEFGLCQFEDNQACEEWALMRGECPEGGVKTAGFDNDQQAYCAWLGGETEAVENAQCKLPDGKTCPVDELWNSQCS